MKVIRPELERREVEPDLQQQRQQEGQGADAEPEQEATENAGAEARKLEQIEIEDWRRGAPGMKEVGDARRGADAKEHRDHAARQKGEPHDRKAEGKSADAEAGKDETDEVETAAAVRRGHPECSVSP